MRNRWQIAAGGLIVLTASVVAAALIIARRPAEREESGKLALTVEVQKAAKIDYPLIIEGFGTVEADRKLTIRAEVGGRAVEQSPHLVLGGEVRQGERLVQIDPRDYLLAVEQERAAVARARFELRVEEGRQVVAKREWELISPSFKATELAEELALRQPHLREKKAALKAAESRLEKAEIDLSRTAIFAPFDGIVLSEAVEVGDLITPQTAIATLAATDRFRVRVAVPYEKLRWIPLPKRGEPAVPATLFQQQGEFLFAYPAEVVRLLGDLEAPGRLAQLLVEVKDPLGKEGNARPPLLIGSYVRVEIQGPLLKQLLHLPRGALREGDTLWIRDSDGRLEIRRVHVLLRNREGVFIDRGLEEGEEVVLTHLSTPLPGMELQVLTP